MPHVFISYHKDSSREYARKFAKHLIDAGFDVWIDDRIDYGTEWERVIFEEGLDKSAAVVVIMTRGAWESVWVRRERQYAEANEIPISPLRVDDYIFPPYLSTQFVEARSWQMPPVEFLDYLEKIGVTRRQDGGRDVAKANQVADKPSAPPPARAVRQAKSKPSRRPIWAGLAVFLAVGAVILVVALVLPNLPSGNSSPTLSPQPESTEFPDYNATRAAITGIQPTASAAEPLPDSIVIAYTVDESIVGINSDGSEQITITEDGSAPAWSPDGSQIAFMRRSGATDNPDIFVMDANGMNQINLTNSPATDSYPAWSPDGSQIVFSSIREETGYAEHLYVMNADGSNVRRITSNDFNKNTDASWSPDGTRIAFTGIYNGRDAVYLIDIDGANLHLLPIEALRQGESCTNPDWSPDGSQIVMTCIWGLEFDIAVVNIDGSNFRRLTDTHMNFHPTWSPDGSQIVFRSTPDDEESNLYVMNVDGSNLRRLTDDPALEFASDWR